jgi:RNA polymerase sigma factor (sigma-70 family)
VLLQFFLKTYTIKTNPRGWLIETARIMLNNWIRRIGLEVFGDEIDAGTIQVAQPVVEDELPPDQTPEQALIDSSARELHAALAKLPARRREVLERFYFGEQKTGVIAREMNIKPDLVRKELERGRRDIRRVMRPTAKTLRKTSRAKPTEPRKSRTRRQACRPSGESNTGDTKSKKPRV